MRTLRRIVLLLSLFVLLAFAVFVVNQTAQVVELAGRLDPRLATATLWSLLVLYAALLITPAVLWWRMPPPLDPPASEDDPRFPEHLARLKRRLAGNRHLLGAPLADRQDVEAALAAIGGEAETAIRDVASTVFLTTAVSQSGRLDALMVLSAHVRLVWRLAHLYDQRPTLRDMAHLYANVAGTAFVAGQIDDIDVSEQIQPVLTAVFGSVTAAVPGMGTASAVLVNSTLSGAANAFLTLRVGMIARQYCGALVLADRRLVRRSATAAAAAQLGSIVRRGAKTLAPRPSRPPPAPRQRLRLRPQGRQAPIRARGRAAVRPAAGSVVANGRRRACGRSGM
ncbi:MAG: DUF697 domain-containing protein [Thermoanaerobaculia bacterium]